MAEAGARIDSAAFERAAKRAPNDLLMAMRRVLGRIGDRHVARVTKDRLSGRPGLFTRTGTLKRSLVSKVIGATLQNLAVVVAIGGNNAPYGPIHETGGTIRSKGKKLAIPLAAAKTPGGVPRFASPRDVPDLKVLPRRGRNTLLVRKTGPRDFIPMYVLVNQVRIPPRLGFLRTWAEQAGEQAQAINDGVAAVLRESFS